MNKISLFKNSVWLRNGSFAMLCIFISLAAVGCSGYSNQSLYPADVKSVCVQMFDNDSFSRGVEYELTDALAKRIEAQTPYKVISSRDKADTVISGRIKSVDTTVLSAERQTGRALEKEVRITAVVRWENLKTGKYLLDNETVSTTATFSEWQAQSFEYASTLAANKLAQKIVEKMEIKW
jgi:dTDP-glucose pyrophosphorylase